MNLVQQFREPPVSARRWAGGAEHREKQDMVLAPGHHGCGETGVRLSLDSAIRDAGLGARRAGEPRLTQPVQVRAGTGEWVQGSGGILIPEQSRERGRRYGRTFCLVKSTGIKNKVGFWRVLSFACV